MSNTKELGITKGEWIYYLSSDGFSYNVSTDDILIVREILDAADAQLISEAGTIANQTGLTPKQLLDKVELLENMIVDSQQQISLTLKENKKLLEQRDELLKCCQNFVDKVESGKARSKKSYSEMKKAIKLITDEKT